MYLLDTNILSELIRNSPHPTVASRFRSTTNGILFTSAVCIEEIRFGAKTGPPGNKLWDRMEALVFPNLAVLSFDESMALIAADWRAYLKRSGRPIGYPDVLIAATATVHGLILVTRNVRHFDHVAGLRIENWFEASGVRPG